MSAIPSVSSRKINTPQPGPLRLPHRDRRLSSSISTSTPTPRSWSFPRLFFPAIDPLSARLASLATFAIAFIARPIGSALFGHFGDRVGRKTTLVARAPHHGPLHGRPSASCPTYAIHRRRRAHPARPLPLRPGHRPRRRMGRRRPARHRKRSAQGNRAWYGMFPQLGAPAGFSPLRRRLSPALPLAHRRAVLPLRLASALPRQRRPRRSSASMSASPLPKRRSSRRTRVASRLGKRVRVPMSRSSRITRARSSRAPSSALHLRPLLSDGRVCALLGHQRDGLQPPDVSASAAGGHSLLRRQLSRSPQSSPSIIATES